MVAVALKGGSPANARSTGPLRYTIVSPVQANTINTTITCPVLFSFHRVFSRSIQPRSDIAPIWEFYSTCTHSPRAGSGAVNDIGALRTGCVKLSFQA